MQDGLQLTATPQANAFVASSELAKSQVRYPLTLKFCADCGHLQLVDIIDPEILFRDYVYVSGTSPSFVAHFERYAASICERLTLTENDLVLDIGSNDGTLLKQFQKRGIGVLGIDPAEAISKSANDSGVPTLCAFFSPATAAGICAERGHAKVITANNVFAHIDDLTSVVKGVRELLSPDGLFVFEVSYLVDVYQGTLFDTIYHEHLDYHRVGPLRRFFDRFGMTLVDAERVSTHGGSLRGFARVGKHSVSDAIEALESLETQLGLNDVETFRKLQQRIEQTGQELSSLLSGLRDAGRSIAAYGAPAKATTLMHQFGLSSSIISYVIDDSPWKQGLFTPGLGLPVVSADILSDDPPDYLVVLAWNFADPIIAKNTQFAEEGGRFIVPLPTLQIRDKRR